MRKMEFAGSCVQCQMSHLRGTLPFGLSLRGTFHFVNRHSPFRLYFIGVTLQHGPYFSQYYFIFAPCIVISHVACLSMCTHKYSVRTVSCAREFANTQVTPDLGHPLVDGLLVRRKVFARTIGICVQSLKKRIEWKLEREKVNMKT